MVNKGIRMKDFGQPGYLDAQKLVGRCTPADSRFYYGANSSKFLS